jgi:hypothetical protein
VVIASAGLDVDVDVVRLEFREEVCVVPWVSMRNDSSSRTVSLLGVLSGRDPFIEVRIKICIHATATNTPAIKLRDDCLLWFSTYMECVVDILNNAIYHK